MTKSIYGVLKSNFSLLLIFAISFSCNEAELEFEEFSIKLTVLHQQEPVAGQWTVTGKDASGVIADKRKDIFLNKENTIRLRAGLHKYSFTLTSGGVSREFTLSGDALIANPNLIVGLSDSDYYTYTTKDGNITLLLSSDPTNPWIEIRVIDPQKIAYCQLVKGFWKGNLPADNVLYRLIEGSEIDNTTFRAYIKFRGQHGISWDEADVDLYYDSFASPYEVIHHTWNH